MIESNDDVLHALGAAVDRAREKRSEAFYAEVARQLEMTPGNAVEAHLQRLLSELSDRHTRLHEAYEAARGGHGYVPGPVTNPALDPRCTVCCGPRRDPRHGA